MSISSRIIRTYRYPLKPTQAQISILEMWLLHCCWLYNGALEERIAHYRKFGKGVSRFGQYKSLTEIRRDPEWAAIPAAVLRSALARVDRSYAAFFRRVKAGEKAGFPRFRSSRRYDSFGLTSAVPKIANSQFRLPNLGLVKFHEYRPLKGVVKDVEIRRDPTGKWYVCFCCEIGEAPPVRVDVAKSTGLDLGLKTFAVLADGSEIANPRFGRHAQRALANHQRALSRRKRNSKSRQRAKVLVAKAHEHIQNQRLDFARKTAKTLVSCYDVIAHEDLKIRNMAQGNLAKSIYDAAWGQFIHALTCKAEEAGKLVIGVDPRGTTQRCSGCGVTVQKRLSVRRHECPECGLSLDRDHNAAINIHTLGLLALKAPGSGVVSLRSSETVRPEVRRVSL